MGLQVALVLSFSSLSQGSVYICWCFIFFIYSSWNVSLVEAICDIFKKIWRCFGEDLSRRLEPLEDWGCDLGTGSAQEWSWNGESGPGKALERSRNTQHGEGYSNPTTMFVDGYLDNGRAESGSRGLFGHSRYYPPTSTMGVGLDSNSIGSGHACKHPLHHPPTAGLATLADGYLDNCRS